MSCPDAWPGWSSRICLEAWNGNSSYDTARIGKGDVEVENTCLSVFGGVQPSRLQAYLADTLRGGPSDDDFIQRFQLLIWPDPRPEQWVYRDAAPNAEAAHLECPARPVHGQRGFVEL